MGQRWWVVSRLATLWLPNKIKIAENQMINSYLGCPEQDSNLHASQHSHLKRARLPFRHLGFCDAKIRLFHESQAFFRAIFYIFLILHLIYALGNGCYGWFLVTLRHGEIPNKHIGLRFGHTFHEASAIMPGDRLPRPPYDDRLRGGSAIADEAHGP